MAVYLPPVAAHLAKVVSKDGRCYSMAGVRVADPGDGTYRLEATDGRQLVVLRGESMDAGLVPEMPELGEEPASAGIIPVEEWTEGFRMLPVANGRNRIAKVLPLGIEMGETSLAMGTLGAQRRGKLLEGRFPCVDGVLPKGPARVTFLVNPVLLANLLQVAKAVLGDGEMKVSFHWWKDGSPIGITASHEGVFFDALLMPLAPGAGGAG